MIDRLSVLCFAGTYGLALLAELARFVVRGAVRWYLAAGLMALGWLVQTAYLTNLAVKSPMAPVGTSFGSLMLLSWIVALIGLYLMVRSPKPVAVGMFVLPLVLGLVVGAGFAGVACVRRLERKLQRCWDLHTERDRQRDRPVHACVVRAIAFIAVPNTPGPRHAQGRSLGVRARRRSSSPAPESAQSPRRPEVCGKR